MEISHSNNTSFTFNIVTKRSPNTEVTILSSNQTALYNPVETTSEQRCIIYN